MIRRSNAIIDSTKSAFFSYEKDMEQIFRKLFVENPAYSENLKRLLVINKPDCLTTGNESYNDLIKGYSVGRLKKEGYIKTTPRLNLEEHEDVKSFIVMMMDGFVPSMNDEYRNCSIMFYIFSEYDYCEMDNYEYRPIKIAGYVDAAMNGARLSGIGTLQFVGAQHVPLNEYWGGISLMYTSTHSEMEDQSAESDGTA